MQVLKICADCIEGNLSLSSAENKIRFLIPSYPAKNLNGEISRLKKCLSGKGSYGFAYPATWAKALLELFDKNPKVIAALNEQQELYYARDGRKNLALEKLLNKSMKPKKKTKPLQQSKKSRARINEAVIWKI